MFLLISLLVSQSILSSGTKIPLLFLETCTVPNNLVCFIRDLLVIDKLLLFIFVTYSLDIYSPFILIFCKKERYVKFRHFEPQSYFIYSYDILKTHLKLNVIGFPPLKKFSYKFINLGFTFIWSISHRFCLSYWCLSINRHCFRFSISFRFWINHWFLWGFWSNIITWYWVACSIHQIGSHRVNQNRIHFIFITVWKILRDES